jgi:hypothetical protein
MDMQRGEKRKYENREDDINTTNNEEGNEDKQKKKGDRGDKKKCTGNITKYEEQKNVRT